MCNEKQQSYDLLKKDKVTIIPESKGPKCTWCGVCVSTSVLLLVLLGLVMAAVAAGPLHAQCSVKWTLSLPCMNVSSLLVAQINEWETEDCPGKSQKCLYSLVSVGDNELLATHTTPLMKFVDDIKFIFNSREKDNCEVLGQSVSRSWYAILDSGTNYCNMYNLMNGSGLRSTPGFNEYTSDSNCTQYSTAKLYLDE